MTKEIENLAIDIMSRMPDRVLLTHSDEIKAALITALSTTKAEPTVEMVTIPKTEYDELIDRDLWLMCLENAGVDNWEGHDIAIEEYRELAKDEE